MKVVLKDCKTGWWSFCPGCPFCPTLIVLAYCIAHYSVVLSVKQTLSLKWHCLADGAISFYSYRLLSPFEPISVM